MSPHALLRRSRRLSIALTAALCLSACSTLPGAFNKDAMFAKRPLLNKLLSSDSLLDYAAAQRARSPSELADEIERLNKAFTTRPSEFTRLRLAVFLATQPQPHGDRSRALSLLDVAAGETTGRGRHHPLASLLIGLLQDAKRADDNMLSAQQKYHDEQKRAEGLQQKLDALRDIDRNIDRKTLERAPARRQR